MKAKKLSEMKKDKNYIVQGNVVRKKKNKTVHKQNEVPEQQNKSERIRQEVFEDRQLVREIVVKVNNNDVRITRIERLWLFRALVWLKLIRK